MIKTTVVTCVSFDDICHEFRKLTGWGDTTMGEWNADFTKLVVNIKFSESTFQHEQDWMCFYYPEDYEHITEHPSSMIDETYVYKENVIYKIGLGEIIRWLQLVGALPMESEFIVTQR